MDRAVSVVILFARKRIRSACRIPDCPRTRPARMNMMTPRIVKIEGVKTPPNVPKRFDLEFEV
jgi:hypothetical protein